MHLDAFVAAVSFFTAVHGFSSPTWHSQKIVPSGVSNPGRFIQFENDGGQLSCGIDDHNNLFCTMSGAGSLNPHWVHISDGVRYVTVSNGRAAILRTNGRDMEFLPSPFLRPLHRVKLNADFKQITLSGHGLCGIAAGYIVCTREISAHPLRWHSLRWPFFPNPVVKHVTLSGNRVVAIDSHGVSWFYGDAFGKAEFNSLGGTLDQAQLDGFRLCGSNGGALWCMDDVRSPFWYPIVNDFRSVSLREGHLTGLNANGKIAYIYFRYFPRWHQLRENMRTIESMGVIMCGIDTTSNLYCYDSNIQTANKWFNIPGEYISITLSGTRLITIDSKNEVVYRKQFKNPETKHIYSGTMKQISMDGQTVCGVDLHNRVHCSENIDDSIPTWNIVANEIKHVSLDGGRLIGVGLNGEISFTRDFRRRVPWKRIITHFRVKQADLNGDGLCAVNEGTNRVFCAQAPRLSDDHRPSNDYPDLWFPVPGLTKFVSLQQSRLYVIDEHDRLLVA